MKLFNNVLVSMFTLFTMVTVIKQWVQLWDPLLHKHGFNCHTRKVWLQRYQVYLCCHVDWCKYYIHLRRLNVRHFGNVKATG
jgi:hypothetical protein